ncbi:MAG: hypothetical protein WA208_11445 [Thermoanaerobaculia bacterium]
MRTGEHGTFPNLTEVIDETLEHGDVTSIAAAIGMPRQNVDEWRTGARRNPFQTSAEVVERLRANGNRKADDPIFAVCRRLGIIAYRSNVEVRDDVDFAALLREFADVVSARAAADADGRRDPSERRELAKQLYELIAYAAGYANHQLAIAALDETTGRFRRVR